MSTSSIQQTEEKRETVNDAKPMKPPIKPKPTVPPRPKQAYASTNSEIKSPLLSPNSEGPYSPTFDIPSAFKISQLTGPQPYGARRTSLKRWSSSVGEELPSESNTMLSPVEKVIPELSTKVTNQPNLKPLQTGSVWKGKSPFMLTKQGRGEQKSHGKDIYGSASQKHSFSSASKDAELKEKETVSEGNVVISSNRPSRFMSTADHREVNTNVQDLKQSFSSVSEEVDKTPLVLTSSGKNKREMPEAAEDDQSKISQETSSQLSVSSQTDIYFGHTKQATQNENIPDTKTEDFSFKSGGVTTGSPEDINEAFRQMKNTYLRTKDYEEPQPVLLVPTAVPKENISLKQNTDNEESSLSDMCKSTSHEVTRHHDDHTTDISEVRTVVKEEQDADSGYMQTSQSRIMVTNQNTKQANLGKSELVEKHAISSETQITDKPVIENEINKNVPLKDKECIESAEHNLLHASEQCDLHKEKTQEASDDNNKPYIYQEYNETVALKDMEPPVCTVRSFQKGSKNTCIQIHEYNIEEEQDEFKNRQDEYDAKVQHEIDVPHQTSEVSEKQTEYPSEYRSVFGTEAKSCYEYNISTAPELPECEDKTSAELCVASQVQENNSLIPGKVYSHLIGEIKEPSHHHMETDTQPNIPQGELSLLESQETSMPESHDKSEYRYSETTSQEPAARVTNTAEFSDHIEQLTNLEYYTAQSPKQNKCEDHLDNLKCRVYESHMPQYNQGQSHEQDFSYTHTMELDDKQSDELVHTHGQSEEPHHKYQQLEKLVDNCEKPDKPNYMYDQLEETDRRSKLFREIEGPDLKYEQTEGSGHQNQEMEYLVNKSYRCEKPVEKILRDDHLEENIYAYKLSDKPVGKYEQSEHLLESCEQPGTIDHKHLQFEEPFLCSVQRYAHSEDLDNKKVQSEELQDNYAYLEGTDHKYEEGEHPGHENKLFDKLTDKYEQKEQPVGVLQTLEEPFHKYETSNEAVSSYKEPEEIIHGHDRSPTSDHVYKQHDEPVHSYEPVNHYGQTEDSGYIQTDSDAKNIACTQLAQLQQQYKPDDSEEIDSTSNFSTISCDKLVECSEKDIRSKEYIEQQLNDNHKEEHKDTSIDGMPDTKQIPKYLLSIEQQLINVHKEETCVFLCQSINESENNQNLHGLSKESPPESPAIATVESDKSMPEKTQDKENTITSQFLNGHRELQTAESTFDQEIQAEEPDISEENFDFLEGTVVLDSSFMRGRASLGKKRGHRTPAGTCDSEEKDPEYWMFRDSTEPKRISETHLEEEHQDEKSPDGATDDSPSPVKSPNKKGIFAGIISPSLLKGRLKTRSKTMEDETVRPEVEEAKSPGKEKAESSGHSLSWLHALKKKKKSIKETTKEEKKKTSK